MQRTGRVLILLSLLSVLVLARTGLSLWGNHTTDNGVVATAQAATESATGNAYAIPPSPDNASGAAKVATSLVSKAIPAANAMPYTPDNVAISDAEKETLLSLRKERNLLDARQKALDERQKTIETGEKKITQRIDDLQQLEARIKDMLAQEQSINTKKIKRLTAVYEGMRAQRAAPVIAGMDLKTVVKMFSRMNAKQVGKILSYLPPKQAIQITQALTERISEVK